MSIATAPPPVESEKAAVPTVPIWRLTVDQYHQMIRTGILVDGDPIELLEGWLVWKMTKNRPHIISTGATRELIAKNLPSGWYVDSQEPITTADSEPEPDVSVVRGNLRDYPDRHPETEDVGLQVEVSDTTLDHDRGIKKRIYARAKLPIYWIVNLIDRKVEVYTEPGGEGDRADYRKREDFDESQSVPLILDGRKIAELPVKELLP